MQVNNNEKEDWYGEAEAPAGNRADM